MLACGGGISAPDTTDTTAPTVISTTPTANASSVVRSSDLTATFDEDMLATSMVANSFTLADSDSSNITGSVTFNSPTNVATFSPDRPLTMLTSYSATLTTAIADLSGNTLATDYNWPFTTADGNRGSAVLVETSFSSDASNPQIAVDAGGNALAVWQQTYGTRTDIWANRFDGSNRGEAELIETSNVGDAVTPQIAIDSIGNALVAWRQSDGSNFNIRGNRFE